MLFNYSSYKKTFCIFIGLFFCSLKAYSNEIVSFKIIGNDRVSEETIIMFSNLKVGSKIDKTILNDTIKDLYYTNYFKNNYRWC